jgi:hypothetical protein
VKQHAYLWRDVVHQALAVDSTASAARARVAVALGALKCSVVIEAYVSLYCLHVLGSGHKLEVKFPADAPASKSRIPCKARTSSKGTKIVTRSPQAWSASLTTTHLAAGALADDHHSALVHLLDVVLCGRMKVSTSHHLL